MKSALSIRSRMEIALTLLYVGLGPFLALRGKQFGRIDVAILGALFFAFGIYRARIIARHFRKLIP